MKKADRCLLGCNNMLYNVNINKQQSKAKSSTSNVLPAAKQSFQ